jgi:phosphoserine phosphatase
MGKQQLEHSLPALIQSMLWHFQQAWASRRPWIKQPSSTVLMAASETAAPITVLPAPQESPPAPFQLFNYDSCSSHLLAHHRHDQSLGATPSTLPFPTIDSCSLDNREMQTVVADLDGTLLRSSSSFPYFMLIAFEAGSPLRALLLLLISPLVYILYHFISEAAGISLLIFVSCAGLKVSAIESAARAVLPKFYLEDMHPVSYKLFTACAHRYVVTANPRIMVEPFLKDYLGVDAVMGTEIQVSKSGYATGFVTAPGVLVGAHKEHVVKKNFGTGPDDVPDVALGDRPTDYPFMRLCKVSRIQSIWNISLQQSLFWISSLVHLHAPTGHEDL